MRIDYDNAKLMLALVIIETLVILGTGAVAGLFAGKLLGVCS